MLSSSGGSPDRLLLPALAARDANAGAALSSVDGSPTWDFLTWDPATAATSIGADATFTDLEIGAGKSLTDAKKVDRIEELEKALEETIRERDELRVRLARQEAETKALKSVMRMGKESPSKGD
ncbi:uncharacterized protein VDAG_01691 [Verticillium dahliae VdLs.17]|uniref:Uncharacterized protein n=1 Tax=Verticillium dahliae (strain VdLs.17 / ATCC MYA-4575 / FGSC 10137) TaxID=498257 RepID=G2WVQ5_VERDV|nr:uncharacterized protein VDAG_01691 [Verticillium dahliae VdLs.17]EGY19675.1 hypothetical protein VDAG_01691 [Verticillium dahliae VdLs.17]